MTKWKLVPVEPDANQIYAMRSAFSKVRRGGIGGQTMDACYQRENAPELSAYSAMLEAAPPPPKLSDERIDELIEEHAPDTKRRYCVDFARAIEREILGVTMTDRDCVHGQLARSCSICDLERELKAVTEQRDKLLAALVEVIQISDRDHDAWNHAKAVIAEVKGGQQG